MSRLKSPAGYLRRSGGAYLARPRIDVATPAVTVIGQATLVGTEYMQSVAIPQPPDGFGWRIDRVGERLLPVGPGVQMIAVATLGEPAPVVRAFLVQDGKRRPTRAVPIVANLPSPQPFRIDGLASIVSTGAVGSPFAVTWPTITSGTPAVPPVQRIDVYDTAGAATPNPALSLTLSGVDPDVLPTTVPVEWLDKFVVAYWSVVDPASADPVRAYASPRLAITEVVVTAPFAAGEITILRSVAKPTGQSLTFSPIFTIAPARRGDQIRWGAGPLTDPAAVQFSIEPNGSTPDEWRLVSAIAPGFPGGGDVSLFRAGEERNSRLRFQRRPNSGVPWSADGPLLTVPAPFIVTNPVDAPDIIVSSVSELLSAASAGGNSSPTYKTIGVAPGTYASSVNFPFISRSVANTLRIIPTNRANPPVFTRPWSFAQNSARQGAAGVVIDGLVFRSDQKDTGPRTYDCSPGRNGSGICYVKEGDWPIATGLSCTNANRIVIRNCTFDFWKNSLNLGSSVVVDADYRPANFDPNSEFGQESISKNILIEYCLFTRNGMDVMRVYNNCNFTVRNCRSDNPRQDPDRSRDDATMHADIIQMAVSRNGFGCFDFRIEDNYFTTLDGYHQVIYGGNERCCMVGAATNAQGGWADEPNGRGNVAIYGHRNGIVRGNYFKGGHINALGILGWHNFLVEKNVIEGFNSNVGVQIYGDRNLGTIQDNHWRYNPSNGHGFSFQASGAGSSRQGPMGTLDGITHRRNTRGLPTIYPAGWVEPATGPYAYNGGVPAP